MNLKKCCLVVALSAILPCVLNGCGIRDVYDIGRYGLQLATDPVVRKGAGEAASDIGGWFKSLGDEKVVSPPPKKQKMPAVIRDDKKKIRVVKGDG